MKKTFLILVIFLFVSFNSFADHNPTPWGIIIVNNDGDTLRICTNSSTVIKNHESKNYHAFFVKEKEIKISFLYDTGVDKNGDFWINGRLKKLSEVFTIKRSIGLSEYIKCIYLSSDKRYVKVIKIYFDPDGRIRIYF